MPSTVSEGRINKVLLVWPVPIPDRLRALCADVFLNMSDLIQYVSRDITKTDTFHLIIPVDCFEQLRNDPVYRFRQVKHIEVICDNIHDLNCIKSHFTSTSGKEQFRTMQDLLKTLMKASANEVLSSSGPIDQSMMNDIVSVIETRLRAKKAAVLARLFPVHNQFTSIFLHGLPVKNMHNFIPSSTCASCRLVYQQPYQLECGHHQCGGCINIQKRCATCFEDISHDKVSSDPNLQMRIKDLSTDCSDCEWTGLYKDYQKHFPQHHPTLIPCLIYNQQAEEYMSHDEISPINSNVLSTSLDGTCIWEISNFNEIKNNAVSRTQNSIYSSPFYLLPNGYKICLRLYVNGDLKAKNTHMSLFFVIMRGEYDRNLQWPFKFKVTFFLIDQSTMNDKDYMNGFCWPDATTECFKCPGLSMNVPYGLSKCFPLDKFEQDRFVRKDTIFIKVQFDMLAEKPTSPLTLGAGELPTDEVHADTIDDDLSAFICTP